MADVTNRLEGIDVLVRKQQLNGATPTVSTVSSAYRLNGYYKMIDSVRNGYFVPGKLRLNPVKIRTTVTSITNGSYKVTLDPKNWIEVTGPYMGYVNSWTVDPTAPMYAWNTNLAQRSLVKAYAKSKTASLELGVILGELRETVDLLRDPLRSVITFFRKREGLFAHVLDPTKRVKVWREAQDSFFHDLSNASSIWLAYRYGLRPLMADIQSALEAINQKVDGLRGCLLRARASVKTNYSDYQYLPGKQISSLTVGIVDRRTTVAKSTSIVYYRVDPNIFANLEEYGISPFDLPGIAYELVPLSFVLDWFVNIGAFLKAIRVTPLATYAGNCTSQRYSIERNLSASTLVPPVGYKLSTHQPSQIRMVEEAMERRTNSTLPVIPPVNCDGFKYLHAIDAASLLVTRVERLVRNVKPSIAQSIR